jgi:hypothetical protein
MRWNSRTAHCRVEEMHSIMSKLTFLAASRASSWKFLEQFRKLIWNGETKRPTWSRAD